MRQQKRPRDGMDFLNPRCPAEELIGIVFLLKELVLEWI